MKILILFILIGNCFSDKLWSWNNSSKGLLGNFPKMRNYNYYVPISSACNPNNNKIYGFACPHMMMFSSDMLLAAKNDNLDKDFYYAVAGASNDNLCGTCYQVELSIPLIKNSTFKQLIIQVVNSGSDVLEGQFDIFMGAGGFGYYDACNNDCEIKHCASGKCFDNQYNGNFDSWTNSEYIEENKCYSGGIQWLGDNKVYDLCMKTTNYETEYKDVVLHQSCIQSNLLFYHQNFLQTKSKKIRCPTSLYKLTGLKRNDEDHYPIANINNNLDIICKGSSSSNLYCITTMQDCCIPSCSWSSWTNRNSRKGNPNINWSRVDMCYKNGSIINYF